MSGTQTPLVSVLIPVLNGEVFLEECLDSALAQDYENLEFIVVDNGSTDATAEIIARYAGRDARFKTHRHPQTIPAADNFQSCHDFMDEGSVYVKWLHADDTLRSDCIRRMVDLAEANPSVGLVSSFMDSEDGMLCEWIDAPEVTPGKEVIRLYLQRKIPYVFGNPTTVLYRSEFSRLERPFFSGNPLLSQQLDIEACYNVLLESDFGFIREPLSWMRVHDESITTRNQTINKRLAGQVLLAQHFAPLVMPPDDAAATLDMMMKRYLKFLSQNLGQDAVFWDFHGQALRELGVRSPRVRIVRTWLARLPHRIARRLGLSN